MLRGCDGLLRQVFLFLERKMDLQELKQIGIEYLNETYQDHEHFDPGSVSAYFDNAVKRHKDYIHLWDIERLKQHLRSYFDSTFGEKKTLPKLKHNFIQVDIELFDNNVMARMGLTYFDIVLIGYIQDKSNGTGAVKYGQKCFAGYESLAEAFSISRKSMIKALDRLIAMNYMSRSKSVDGKVLHDVSNFIYQVEMYKNDLSLVHIQAKAAKVPLTDQDIINIASSYSSNYVLGKQYSRDEKHIRRIKAGKVLPRDPILSQEYTEICNRRKQSKQAREDGRSLNNVLHLNLGVK